MTKPPAMRPGRSATKPVEGCQPGMVAAEAQRAATAAAKHYERTVARPRFNGTTAAPLEFVSREEAPA